MAISWFVVLFFLLYPFLKHNTTPNFWLLIALAGIPLLMLIQKLKIANLFDFSKSDSPPHQTTTTIGQQINLPIMGQDLAEAITESISKELKRQKDQLSSSSQNKYSKYNTLNYSIDLVLMNSLPTLIAYYSLLTTMVRGKPLKKLDDNLKKPIGLLVTIALSPQKKIDYSSLFPLITIIQANIKSVFSSYTEQLSLHFSNIQKLIELRTSTASTTDELEFNKDTLDILLQAMESAGSLSSFMMGNWEASRFFMQFSFSSLKALAENKPINKPGNK